MPKFNFALGNRHVSLSTGNPRVNQCQKPTGLIGRFILWRMNASHSKLTDWGLRHITIKPDATILDVGCGGGRTVDKLAATATAGRVYGVDFSDESVRATRRMNARWIDIGRVEIAHASVSALPFSSETFDVITAVETHFWWADLPGDLREILRVLKPDGQLALIAEIYKGANTLTSRLAEQQAAHIGMTLLGVDEHRDLLATAGLEDVQIDTDADKGWICATGRRATESGSNRRNPPLQVM
jgi:SAM-dependent methyltransferase